MKREGDRLRIAVVTQYFPVREQPYRGHSAYQTLRCLVRLADVHVFAPQARYPSFLLPQNRPWARTDLAYSPPDVPLTNFNYPALPVLSRPVNGLMIARRLEPLIRSYRPDVMLNFWIYPDGYGAVRVGRKLGIPVVLGAIGSDLNKIPRGLDERYIRSALREADRVLTVSDGLRKRAIELGSAPDRTEAILNGCDTSIFRPVSQWECRKKLGIEPGAQLVLYVGRYDVLKGLVELVRACATLTGRFPSLQLAMVGEGPAREVIERTATETGFSSRLRLVSPCPSDEVARWMNASDVFALPSYNEGCPNVVVEALGCGRPVVATRVGGIPELVNEQNGILVPPREVEPLAEALGESLLHAGKVPETAAVRARSWDDVAQDVLALCQSAVTDRRAQPQPHEVTYSK